MSNENTEVVETRGEYRAVIEIDQYPSEPENECGNPVLRIDSGGYRNRVDFTGYGSESAKHDGITRIDTDDALAYFIDKQGVPDGVDTFARWLRIFHGGDAVGYHLGYSREYGYVAYSTRKMAYSWGQTDETLAEHPEYLVPELDEWRAYCEGEVYLVRVQRRLLKRTEYVTLDDHHPVEADEREVWFDVEDTVCGGYYGEKYAREAAVEALADFPGPNHEVFVVWADNTKPTSTWSVHREEYLNPHDDEPIATRRMSTWVTEEMAQAAAVRLRAGETR